MSFVPYTPSEAVVAEWRRIVADHTLDELGGCPMCGPSGCEPTWRRQRQWAQEMLTQYALDDRAYNRARQALDAVRGVTDMTIKDYWAAPRTTPEGDEPEGETSPAVPDAEPRD